jgi:5-methylcytosine-specific restriction enzyme B
VSDVQRLLTAKLPTYNASQNLLGWRLFDFLRKLDSAGRLQFVSAFLDFLFGGGDSADRVERFNRECWPVLDRIGATSPAWSRSFPTLFLMLQNPDADIFIRTTSFDEASWRVRGELLFENRPLDADEYRKAHEFAEAIRSALDTWGWEPRDLVDVQSFLFVCEYVLKRPEPDNGGEGNGESPKPPPESVGEYLAGTGLYFSQEIVANYVLALQTRRFVILTGISGTGKTQLAMRLAEYCRPTVHAERATELPEGGVELKVHPYMLKYGQLVLPASVTARFRFPPVEAQANGGQVAVVYPGGETKLAFWRDPQRPVTSLSFRGDFRRWAQRELTVGDRFLLAIDEGAEGEPDRLRFLLPQTEHTAEPLDNTAVIAVRPDWTDGRSLLGYLNPITGKYIRTPFLRLLLRAAEEELAAEREDRSPHPFFAVLDEMNLARVEHYFSDFLSSLESGEPLDLHDDLPLERGEGEDGIEIPRRLPVPGNVFFTGTVNVDETTHMFSPKVLDRAFTIELVDVDLSVYADGMSGNTQPADGLTLGKWSGTLRFERRPDSRDWTDFGGLLNGSLRKIVVVANDRLATTGRHFGYRVANEIARFVLLARGQTAGTAQDLWAALDLAMLQKVLPKFHGTQQELEPAVETMLGLAINGEDGQASGLDAADWRVEQGRLVREDGAAAATLPRTAAKLWRMREQLRRQGFASYIQ